MAEWQKWIRMYYLWYTPTPTTPTTTLKSFIVQADRAYGTEISPRLFVISFVILLYAISYNICFLLFVIMWVVDWKKLQMQACRLQSHTVDVTPPQAATKIMAGMAEQQTEWPNWMADGMVEWREWQNGRNGYIRTIYGTRRHRQHRQRHLNLL